MRARARALRATGSIEAAPLSRIAACAQGSPARSCRRRAWPRRWRRAARRGGGGGGGRAPPRGGGGGGVRRVAEARGELARLRGELRVRDDAVDEPELQRAPRVNRVAEEEHLARDVRRHHAREEEGAAPVRVQSYFDERLAEGRGLGG